eukprot:10352583-Ditylum_brightwellii.AAC.1
MTNQDSSTNSASFASSTTPQYIRSDIVEHPDTQVTLSDIKYTYTDFDSMIDVMHQQGLTPAAIDIALGTFINEGALQAIEEAYSGEEQYHYDDNE